MMQLKKQVCGLGLMVISSLTVAAEQENRPLNIDTQRQEALQDSQRLEQALHEQAQQAQRDTQAIEARLTQELQSSERESGRQVKSEQAFEDMATQADTEQQAKEAAAQIDKPLNP